MFGAGAHADRDALRPGRSTFDSMATSAPRVTIATMQLVEVQTRPARLAFIFRKSASNRVARRAFRLASSRWGGMFDLILELSDESRSLCTTMLRVADPDVVMVIDPGLDIASVEDFLRQADRQPFAVDRLRERMEFGRFEFLFRPPPIAADTDATDPHIYDTGRASVGWGEIAAAGLPPANPQGTLVRKRAEGVHTPASLTARFLKSNRGPAHFCIVGERESRGVACLRWSLRAIGASPSIISATALTASQPPIRAGVRPFTIAMISLTVDPSVLSTACDRWSSDRFTFASPTAESIAEYLARDHVVLASDQTAVVAPHRGSLLAPTPPLSGAGLTSLARDVPGVLAFRLRSTSDGDPDGVQLARNAASRELLADRGAGRTFATTRITSQGLADGIVDLAHPILARIPALHYRDIVSAALGGNGIEVIESDKGRYQQRALELASGLRFLAYLLRQPESSRLLDLFFERPPKAPPEYRRAVTFGDLERAVVEFATLGRNRLRAPRREAAFGWLRWWTDALITSELLRAGYLLDCRRCALRNWYEAGAVGQRFQCRRCGAEGVVPASSVRSFRLNEAFFQMRLNNGHVVSLVLAAMRRRARTSFLYLPEIQVRTQNDCREIDAAALVDGNLFVVEAKSTDTISSDDWKIFPYLSARARIDRIVLATAVGQDGAELCRFCGRSDPDPVQCRAVWSPPSQTQIGRLESRLHGPRVETWCRRALTGPYAQAEFSEFQRGERASPVPASLRS